MNAYTDNSDKPTFIDYEGYRITTAYMRVGTSERTVHRIWLRGDGVWQPLNGVYESAEDAKAEIEEMK